MIATPFGTDRLTMLPLRAEYAEEMAKVYSRTPTSTPSPVASRRPPSTWRPAARGLVAWLDAQGIERVIAHVHPDHTASAAVTAAAGLTRTDHLDDDEYLWTT